MQKVWRWLRKPDSLALLIVIFFGLLAGKGLFGSGYFNMHDDLQMMRQLQMEKCFLDGQIPCRWVPDMGYGFGYPLFNYYPPLPYLVGEGIRLVGYSFVATAKILFVLSFVASGITMYYLAKDFFGRFGGVISSIFYIWAPYHSEDVYVRGAMNEAWALIWFPLILWSGYKLITCEKKHLLKYMMILALAWFGLFTSHNLMVLIFSPVFAAWCGIWYVMTKKWKTLPYLVTAGIWSFALAAFFTLPVLVEKGIVQTNTLVVGYYEYTAHFATISQLLFSRFWGYGPSAWLVDGDGMSFQIGWIHWGLSLFLLVLISFKYAKNKKIEKWVAATLFLIAVGWFGAFIAHGRSTPIWQMIGELKFVQFPWRFLTMVILGFSFAAGSMVKLFQNRVLGKILILVILLGVLVYSWSFFRPEHGKLGPLTDEEKFSGVAWDMLQTAGIYDYLPNTAKTAPKAPRGYVAEVVSGEGEIPAAQLGTNWAKVTVYMQSAGTVRLNIFEFPNWVITDGTEKLTQYVPEDEEWGRMHLDLSAGRHELDIKLQNTWSRTVGNWVSVVAWAGLAVAIYYLYRNEANPSMV